MTVARVLDANAIDYMITGSIASSLQGEPRLTHDIDLVTVEIPRAKIAALKKVFPEGAFYFDEQSVLDANKNKGMFNTIEMATGNKLDFWILTESPFDQSRFSRKYTIDIKGQPVKFSRPEDTILAKLHWIKLLGGSEKHFIDALRVYELQFHLLDLNYLERWAHELEVRELWMQIQDRAVTL